MANNILEMALEQLDFPPSTISAWFDDVTVVSFGDNRLVLHSPVPLRKNLSSPNLSLLCRMCCTT